MESKQEEKTKARSGARKRWVEKYNQMHGYFLERNDDVLPSPFNLFETKSWTFIIRAPGTERKVKFTFYVHEK